MDILGIGPLELVFILIIALIVLGPKDMVKAGKTIGRTLRTIISSDTWRVVQDASREIRNLPNRMMREAALDDLQKQLPNQSSIRNELGLDELDKSLKGNLSSTPGRTPSSATGGDLSSWTTPPPTIGKLEHMQAADSQPAPPSEGVGSWSEPYTSRSAASDGPVEAENPADIMLPPNQEQAAAEGSVQAEETLAVHQAQEAGTQVPTEEPSPEDKQLGSN
jgi:Sec-independent protein translocase protein TatA